MGGQRGFHDFGPKPRRIREGRRPRRPGHSPGPAQDRQQIHDLRQAEATHPRDQKEMTMFERTQRTALLGTFGGRFARGAGNPERAWLADVLKRIRTKYREVDDYPNPMPEYVLLLYSNSNAA